MRAPLAVTAVAALWGTVGPTPSAWADPADPKPSAVDVSAYKAQLRVFKDDVGDIYIVKGQPEPEVFYGDGKVVHQQLVIGGGRDEGAGSWEVNVWAPRVTKIQPGTVGLRPGGTYYRYCGEDGGSANKDLTEVTGDAGKAIIDKVAFQSPLLVRRPAMLARDDHGVYYYVDRLDKAHGGKGYRVFVGMKGAMKPMPLKAVVDDSGGQIYSTKRGELRLVSNSGDGERGGAVWIQGKKQSALTVLDLDVNSHLIFRDLGIYGTLGTICDDL